MLEINNLKIEVVGKEILTDVSLSLNAGALHVLMGSNGAGKTTLANFLAGKDSYKYLSGQVTYKGHNLITMPPEDRAKNGIFVAFQYPIAIPGLNNLYFLRQSLNSIRNSKNLPPLDAADVISLAKEKIKYVGLDESFLFRDLNDGFSGGEKKRNEMLQLLLLEPEFMILDETDSGLDIDALKMVSDAINMMRSPLRSFLVITHYQKLLEYIKPDFVHVLHEGRIVISGDYTLAQRIEKEGYGWLEEVV